MALRCKAAQAGMPPRESCDSDGLVPMQLHRQGCSWPARLSQVELASTALRPFLLQYYLKSRQQTLVAQINLCIQQAVAIPVPQPAASVYLFKFDHIDCIMYKPSSDLPLSNDQRGAPKTKLLIVMVGLPARGKSFISHRLTNYLTWFVFSWIYCYVMCNHILVTLLLREMYPIARCISHKFSSYSLAVGSD